MVPGTGITPGVAGQPIMLAVISMRTAQGTASSPRRTTSAGCTESPTCRFAIHARSAFSMAAFAGGNSTPSGRATFKKRLIFFSTAACTARVAPSAFLLLRSSKAAARVSSPGAAPSPHR